MINNTEILLKRFLKRKIKITTALITVFMITGTISLSETIPEIISKANDYDKEEYSLDPDGVEKGVYNFIDENKTTLNFSNKGLYVKNSSSSEKTDFQFFGSGELLAEKDSDNAIKSEKEWISIKTLGEDKDLKIDSKEYKVKNAIEVNNQGNIAISDFRNVEIGSLKGIYNAYEKNININNGSILIEAGENISLKNAKTGIYVNGKGSSASLKSKEIEIMTVSDEESIKEQEFGVRATEEAKITLYGKDIKIAGNKKNNKYFHKDGAILAEKGGDINLTADGKISILGDVISNEKASVNIKKSNKSIIGNTEIALNLDEIKNYRENKFTPSEYNWALISSENESKIEFDLKGKNEKGIGSIFIGQAKDNIGTSQEGKITLNMDKDSVWVPRNSNSITNLNLNGGKIDLAADKTSKVHIKDLKGEGTFSIFANTYNKDQGNMLYIQNYISENGKEISENKLNLQNINLEALEKGEKVRFATLGKNAKGKVIFKDTVVEERGIQDIGVKVNKETFDINDGQNKNYTDKSIFNDKYDFKNYKDGENWYITKEYKVIPGMLLVPALKPQEPEVKPPAEDENKQPEINPPMDKPEVKPPAEDENKQPEINPPMDKPENKPEVKPPVENQNNQSETVPPINKPEKPNRDNDITKSVIEMSKANYVSAVYMDNLNKRLGDITFAEGQDGIWVRLRNDRVGESNEYRLRNYITQVGYDKVYSVQNGTTHRGAAIDYTKGGMDYKNITGNSHIDKYIISAYDTKIFNDGLYTDIVARVGYMKSDFDITTSKHKYQVRGDYSNIIFGLSAEAGQKFTISEKTYFEPQVQLQYTYIGETNYTTNQGTKVELEEINSLIGRVGFRLGHDFYKENKKDNTIYLKTNLNYEMLGEQKVKASDLTGRINRKYENNVMWIDLGVGAAKDVTEDLNLYTDIEKQFGESKDNNSWQINAGFRYKFDM